ncbi:hypothetical protein [Shewanella baltica]|uniref:hypothetical protein n=1 Tax=Shewanella baltica TaxID=62322 RepID=UPI003218414D
MKDSDGNPPPKVPDYNRTAQAALRAYFENGGGYCYLVLTSELARYVPTLDGVTLIVAAGKPLSDVQSQVGLMMEAEPSLRIFTIYDGPTEELDINSDPTSMLLTASNQAAVYYPWLEAPWAVHPTELEEDGTKKKTYVPPSGAIAGVYCTVGRERGVWKAPANVPLKGDLRPVYKVSDELMWQL